MKKRNVLLLLFAFFSTTMYLDEILRWTEDQITFAKVGFRDKTIVGTVFQCSRWTSEKLASKIPHYTQRNNPVRVLELGPGVGSVTSEIIKKLDFSKGDHFELVEIEETYCNRLHEKFGYLEKQFSDTFIIHHQDALTFEPKEQYDFIICTIPFNACPPDFVKAILNRCKNLFIKKETEYGWFEFVSYPKTVIELYVKLFMEKENLENFKASKKITTNFRKRHKSEVMQEFLNIPPGIQVYHVGLNKKLA